LSAEGYLDIHSHLRAQGSLAPEHSSVVVASLSWHELEQESAPFAFITAGIHPWWLEELEAGQIEILKQHVVNLLTQGRLWGLGETGLDRLYPEYLPQQKELFFWHWELAEKFQLPLIIHSVRAGSDFLEFLKARPPTTAWIFHDFRGNWELVKNLLRLHPQSYFSFGLSVDNSPQVRELLPFIPLENLFLETDNQKHLDIHDIYLRAAEILQVDMALLKSQLWYNFNKITPIHH
jgi:TatD DNase family protein